jgi:tRNA-dihydrouridine synthase
MLARHGVDLVTVHGRTVAGMYRTPVRYDLIAQAAAALPCPVLANGNIDSPVAAETVLRQTGVHGLMIGRGAIRNPWLFDQIRQHLRGEAVAHPTGRDVLAYIGELYDAVCAPGVREAQQVQKMKKYLNFIGLGVEPTGAFLHAIRRAESRTEFFRLCTEYLSHGEPMPLEPYTLSLAAHDVLAADPA